MIWFISDEHYYHSNIISYRFKDSRPFNTIHDMNQTIIHRHNEVVNNDDTVYHLGDFTFSKYWREAQTLLSKLKGIHILILGNHDLFKPFEYIDIGFQSVHTSLQLEDITLIHDPAVAGVFTDMRFIHGHTHGLGIHLAKNTFGVSVELSNYYPVSFENIKEYFRN